MKKVFAILALAFGIIGHAQAQYVGVIPTKTEKTGVFDGGEVGFTDVPCTRAAEILQNSSAKVAARDLIDFFSQQGGNELTQLDSKGNITVFGCYTVRGNLVTITWQDNTTKILIKQAITWAQ